MWSFSFYFGVSLLQIWTTGQWPVQAPEPHNCHIYCLSICNFHSQDVASLIYWNPLNLIKEVTVSDPICFLVLSATDDDHTRKSLHCWLVGSRFSSQSGMLERGLGEPTWIQLSVLTVEKSRTEKRLLGAPKGCNFCHISMKVSTRVEWTHDKGRLHCIMISLKHGIIHALCGSGFEVVAR